MKKRKREEKRVKGKRESNAENSNIEVKKTKTKKGRKAGESNTLRFCYCIPYILTCLLPHACISSFFFFGTGD